MAQARLAQLVERYHYHRESHRILARRLITASFADLPCLDAASHAFELKGDDDPVERSAELDVGGWPGEMTAVALMLHTVRRQRSFDDEYGVD